MVLQIQVVVTRESGQDVFLLFGVLMGEESRMILKMNLKSENATKKHIAH